MHARPVALSLPDRQVLGLITVLPTHSLMSGSVNITVQYLVGKSAPREDDKLHGGRRTDRSAQHLLRHNQLSLDQSGKQLKLNDPLES